MFDNFMLVFYRMKSFAKYLLVLLIFFFYSSCSNNHGSYIASIIPLTEQSPDSALFLLSKIDQKSLSKKDFALYSLVYTIAQDKSGLEVNNDSLIRHAYNWYKDNPTDTLYAKCEYYMGLYYVLNDSIEKAADCLQKSIKASEMRGQDKKYLCLALTQYSRILEYTEPQKAITFAKKAVDLYRGLPNASISNLVYYKLNLCVSLLLVDSLEQATKVCREAIYLCHSSDSTLLSDAYQDMASIQSKQKKFQRALWYSKKSYTLSKIHDTSKLLNLAWAYVDADSLRECNRLLRNLNDVSPSSLYTAYYIRQISAMKNHKFGEAVLFADSANHYLEEMYSRELEAKNKYYSSLTKSQYDKGKSEGRANLFVWLLVFISLSAVLVVLLIMYFFKQYKANTKNRMKNELRKREIQRMFYDEQIKHREIQLVTMRKYIISKVQMAQKIKEIKNNHINKVTLTSKEWDEIMQFVESVEDGFVTRIKKEYPKLSGDDIKFFILIRLKMSAKVMSMIYGISEKSIRQKLYVYKSKVGLDNGANVSLRTFIENF